MNRLTFEILDEKITAISNMMPGSIETREKVQKILFYLVYDSCFEFSRNEEFKNQLHSAVEYLYEIEKQNKNRGMMNGN